MRSVYTDWICISTSCFTTTKSYLSGLTVKIGSYWGENGCIALRAHSTARILQAYEEDIIYPLMQLQGLKVLLFHVPCPFGRGIEEARVQIERSLEQMVMSPDYNADFIGKVLPEEYTRLFLFDEWQ